MPATVTEHSTLAALRRGDDAEFRRLVERHHAAMVHVAMGFVRNRATADEVVQDAWLGFLGALDRFEGRASLRTFLLTIVANKARTRALREARTVPLSSVVPDGDGDDDEPAVPAERFLAAAHERWPRRWAASPALWSLPPDGRLIGRETLEVARRAIDALPPRQRVVILLRDVHGLAPAETRAVLALSEGNQRVLLHRARSRVRAALADYLGDRAAA